MLAGAIGQSNVGHGLGTPEKKMARTSRAIFENALPPGVRARYSVNEAPNAFAVS
jgi:hypothetical protein